MKFYPEKVLEGEVWRVVTFLFEPPGSNLIFAFLFWYLFYLFGTTLEITWGTFRYNVYLLVGYLASVAAAFALYFGGQGFGTSVSSGFLYGTVFLAFARLYPDFVLTLFFVLPVKVKWLALLQWIGYAARLHCRPDVDGAGDDCGVGSQLLAVFWPTICCRRFGTAIGGCGFRQKPCGAQLQIVHKCHCAESQATTHRKMQFRYCSKCEGDCCYCPEHLRNHEHVVVTAGEKQA